MRALLEGQELERSRLARELHDETGQALASILLGLKTLEKQVGEEPLVQLRELVASALGDVRRLTVELRPPALDDFGLEGGARTARQRPVGEEWARRAAERGRRAGCRPTHETAIYRIVQEALTNIIKHAQAHAVSVVIAGGEGSVRVVIEDDGVGFAPDRVRESALGPRRHAGASQPARRPARRSVGGGARDDDHGRAAARSSRA